MTGPLPHATLAALEVAALAAWPALESLEQDGWQLRCAQGYTKRANSANATPLAQPLNPARLAAIEQVFHARGLPPIFRLPSFCTPAGTDAWLADRGYRQMDPSLVMARPLANDGGSAPDPSIRLLPEATAWLPLFMALSAARPESASQALHLRLLQAISHPCALAVLEQDGQPVGCGLAVLVDGHLGLFDLVTSPAWRRHGVAHRLCQHLLAWGHAQGARQAYLQVLAANTPARALYEQLGLRTAYHYHYRVAPA